MLYLIFFVMIVFLLLQPKKENFVEMFGFSGYNTPIGSPELNVRKSNVRNSDYVPVKSGMTHDDINSVVRTVTDFVSKETKLCLYPIETNKIEKFINPQSASEIVKVRFMYMVTSTGFPFMFGVDAEVLDGKVVTAKTQELYNGGKKEMSSDNFLPFSEIENFHVYSR